MCSIWLPADGQRWHCEFLIVLQHQKYSLPKLVETLCNHHRSSVVCSDGKGRKRCMFFSQLYACRDGSGATRCILWILVVQFMFTDRICVVTPSYWG